MYAYEGTRKPPRRHSITPCTATTTKPCRVWVCVCTRVQVLPHRWSIIITRCVRCCERGRTDRPTGGNTTTDRCRRGVLGFFGRIPKVRLRRVKERADMGNGTHAGFVWFSRLRYRTIRSFSRIVYTRVAAAVTGTENGSHALQM